MGLLDLLFGSDEKKEERPYQTAPEEWGQPGTEKYYYESYLHNMIMSCKNDFYKVNDNLEQEIFWYSDYKEVYRDRYGYVDEYKKPAGAIDLDSFIKKVEPIDDNDPWQVERANYEARYRKFYSDEHDIVYGVQTSPRIIEQLSRKTLHDLKILEEVFKYQLRNEQETYDELYSDD